MFIDSRKKLFNSFIQHEPVLKYVIADQIPENDETPNHCKYTSFSTYPRR